jgi:hypothetical protein
MGGPSLVAAGPLASRRRRPVRQPHTYQQLIDRRTTMSKLTRTLILGVALAAMNLAGMAVAQAQPPDGVEQFRRGKLAPQEQSTTAEAVEEFRRGERAAQEQSAADAAVQRQLNRERHSIPSGTPAKVPAPAPAEQNGQSGWLLASLGVLTVILALVGGLAVLATRRASRRARLGHAA